MAGGEFTLLCRHSKQDEFIYVLEGTAILVTESEELSRSPGMCAGSPANGFAFQLVNRTESDGAILGVADRTLDEKGSYPNDDTQAVL
ncbi:cupin domain-containing protein [Pelagibius sp.]|uniref:cupin domain-containing protein n=1 Tax=Pelagibius sp. TaxID=1931238 RepID=UPI002609C741|nr:cupin domain-containing protein [Pelagibius sp.]